MGTSKINLIPLLDYIDPADCDYPTWMDVGMALHHEGYSAEDWDSWSQRDGGRYHGGECQRKWKGFMAEKGITGATITELAKRGGWRSESKNNDTYGWDDDIEASDYQIVNTDWIEDKEIAMPETWDPVQELSTYLSTLFDSTDIVGYVVTSWEKDGKYLPTKGSSKQTAGEIIENLSICDGDIGKVLGDYKPEVGAWIRFNPLDGKGVNNDNVTGYNFALVESDTISLEKQYAILTKLELPIAALVHSGKKSLHAIVHIDAANYSEYQKRVDFLYSICEKNGLEIDRQNRNPSRLSRMPGIIRGDAKQFLIATNIGKRDFVSWQEWVEEVNDNLPDIERLEDVFHNLPPLSPPLIDGVLRQGHKMLLAGPSKAGKSFALIELCIALAEGRKWLDFKCSRGKVLYANLELDRASCLHRFYDVYQALEIPPDHVGNIDIWNLRGKSVPMDKLAPKLIRRAQKGNYIAIVIDPIYKVITGDENSADQMAHFCNQFDKVCTELGCAVIYCHHHSKGAQGGKRSMDRASGSGVFARDPDALIDMIELDVEEDVAQERTAWKLEGTLREFKPFPPIKCWFEYPVHKLDDKGELALAGVSISEAPKEWSKKANDKKKKTADERRSNYSDAYNILQWDDGRDVTVKDMAEYFGTTEKTVRRDVENKNVNFKIENCIIIPCDKSEK